MITSDNSLTPNFAYIKKLREDKSSLSPIDLSKKSALVLGAGMVTGPLVCYLDSFGIKQTLASQFLSDGENLISRCKTNHASPLQIDLSNEADRLKKLVDEHDIVISLVPYTLHHLVAKAAIETKTNMITASYLSPVLKDMEADARAAGIFVLNELGLDPGIDHMLAMECFNDIKDTTGNSIKSFISFCGGLPAPEASDNALRYKFSWSPRGVLMAAMNPAIYFRDNETVTVPAGGEILKNRIPVEFYPGFNLEAIPNRDSTTYKEPYELSDVETMLRGTLRFSPFCDVVYGLKSIGLCDMEQKMPQGAKSWKEVLEKLDFEKKLKSVPENQGCMDKIMKAMKELGLFSDEALSEKVRSADNVLDAFANHLSENLVYLKNERDFVVGFKNFIGAVL